MSSSPGNLARASGPFGDGARFGVFPPFSGRFRARGG
jgi:hypothetical protein